MQFKLVIEYTKENYKTALRNRVNTQHYITDLTAHTTTPSLSSPLQNSRYPSPLLRGRTSMDPLSNEAAAIQSSSSSSSLKTNHKARAARLDAQSQRKMLSRSAISESLDYFLPKGSNNSNPNLVRTVSDSRKLLQSQAGLVATKGNVNPEKERWRRKFYGGEIVKLIYDTSKEKKTRKNAEGANGEQQRLQAPEERERVEDVKQRLAKLEIVEVNKIDADLKRVSRRRSFCGEETSLSSFLTSNGARIVAVDMPPFMQIHAIDCARKAYNSLEKFTSKSLALSLKKVSLLNPERA